jgi:hypothetical protein
MMKKFLIAMGLALMVGTAFGEGVYYDPNDKDDPFGEKRHAAHKARDRANGTYRGINWPFEGISVPIGYVGSAAHKAELAKEREELWEYHLKEHEKAQKEGKKPKKKKARHPRKKGKKSHAKRLP